MVWALAALVAGVGVIAVSYHSGRDLCALLIAFTLVLVGLVPTWLLERRGAPPRARALSPAVFGVATIIIGVAVIQPLYLSPRLFSLYHPPLAFAFMFDMPMSAAAVALGVRGAVGTRGKWRLLALAGAALCLVGPWVSGWAYDAWTMRSLG